MKHGILALLTQGSAYGLQVRNELTVRVQRETPFNVGQIYATIDRLTVAGLLVSDQRTSDGLPLYSLTEEGQSTAEQWISVADPGVRARWESMTFQVLLVRSLPGVDSSTLISSYEDFWRQVTIDLPLEGSLAQLATQLQAEAALTWLSQVAQHPLAITPLSSVRPPRGRPAREKPEQSGSSVV